MLLKLDPRPKVRNVKEEKQDAAQTLICLLFANTQIREGSKKIKGPFSRLLTGVKKGLK